MYISAKNDTQISDELLAEEWEQQIKAHLKELTYRWTAIESSTNSIFSFSQSSNFCYFIY